MATREFRCSGCDLLLERIYLLGEEEPLAVTCGCGSVARRVPSAPRLDGGYYRAEEAKGAVFAEAGHEKDAARNLQYRKEKEQRQVQQAVDEVINDFPDIVLPDRPEDVVTNLGDAPPPA